MRSFYIFKISFLATICFFFITGLSGQTNIHHSDFSTSQGEEFTISGPIGATEWTVSRSGQDWGARIHNDRLELTNTASSDDNANGWVYAFLETEDFTPAYNKILEDNTETLTWYFNMRQIRDNPAGFGSNSYGAAFIIGSTSSNVASEGDGYAIVLGNTSSPDPIRFVKFSGGIQSIGNSDDGLIIADEPLNDPTNDYMSLKLTYDPATNEWNLYGRNDGSSFQDPQSGELSFLGSVTNNEHTNKELDFMGAYWQGSTAANQTAFYDNVSIWTEETGPAPPTISNITQSPETNITPETTVSVSAEVTPGDAPNIESVELHWGVAENNLENIINMLQSNGDTYTTDTDIPAHSHNTTVYYKIIAEDDDGITGTSSLQGYQVIDPDFTLDIINVENPDAINVALGTPFDELPLPETVTVILENDADEDLDVNWQEGDYDPGSTGTYYLQGELVLTEGIENPDDLHAEIAVTVTEHADEELIAAWTFPVESQEADQGIAENIGNMITREPEFTGSYSYFGGVEDNAISTTSWQDGEGTKYWKVELSTLNYGDLNISSAQRSSGTGPRDFKVQYRIGETGDWNDVENSDIEVDEGFTAGVLNELPLPSACNNKSVLFLRWVMTSNTNVNGETVAGAGASRIDMIKIKGYYSDDFELIVMDVDNPDDITVEEGTAFEELPLPEEVNVHLDDLSSEFVPVLWQKGDYDESELGTYTLEGELDLPSGIENPDNIKAYINVEVIPEIVEYTITFNLDMSEAPGFDPDNDEVYIRGDMNNWTIPGAYPGIQLMEPSNDDPLIYTITFQLEGGTYEYKYYINDGISNPEGGENRSVDVADDKTVNDKWIYTGITEQLTEIKVYPNPFSSNIYLNSNAHIKYVVIMNSIGQTMRLAEVKGSEVMLNTSDLKNGIYFLKVIMINGNQITKKLIKQ